MNDTPHSIGSRSHFLCAAVLTVILAAPAPAQAATITVEIATDDPAASPCTLRDAITNANNDDQSGSVECEAGSGDDDIVFEPGLAGQTITLVQTGAGEDANASGDLDVDGGADSLEIIGPTAGDPGSIVIDGNGDDRVFDAHSNLTLRNLTVRNGQAPATYTYGGGGILSRTVDLGLEHVRVSGNATAADGGDGGGMLIIDNATIADSTIADNSTAGIDAHGGGLAVSGGTLSLVRSTVSGNSTIGADARGGGLAVVGSGHTLVNSTVSGNSTVGSGFADGGGILVRAFAGITINNATIAGNAAPEGGGGIFNNAGSVTLSNSIVAGNEAGNDGPDCLGGEIMSGGYNLVGDDTDCLLAATGDDLLDVDPGLAPLADNGGPTRTHALIEGSPAVDAGDPNIPGAGGTCEIDDQRSEARPDDGDDDGAAVCDIGAFEGTVTLSSGGSGGGGGGAFGPLMLVLLGWLACGVVAGRGRGVCRPARESPCVTMLGRRSPHSVKHFTPRVRGDSQNCHGDSFVATGH